MHRFSTTVEKERPQLNEETKRLIALCRRDPTEENLAALRRQVIRNARQVIALADHSKFSIRAVHNICPLSDIDILVTDSAAPSEILDQCREKGVRVCIAEGGQDGGSRA